LQKAAAMLGRELQEYFANSGAAKPAPAPPTLKVASADGVPIAYEVHGQGSPALVLVHGWSCDRSYWQGQVEPLSRHYQVITLDLAGHGVVLAYSTIAAADLAAGRLVRLFSLALPDLFAYYIVTAPGALERPKVRAFRDWLRQEADG
jgi:DNA-binding transcriptional LysR family regulator